MNTLKEIALQGCYRFVLYHIANWDISDLMEALILGYRKDKINLGDLTIPFENLTKLDADITKKDVLYQRFKPKMFKDPHLGCTHCNLSELNCYVNADIWCRWVMQLDQLTLDEKIDMMDYNVEKP